jgi:hypothetical protein
MPAQKWDLEIDRWRAWNSSAETLLYVLSDVKSFGAVNASTTAGVSLTAMYAIQSPSISPADLEALRYASIRFHATIDRPTIAEEVRTAMRRLSLDARSEVYRSALTILDEAVAAINIPVAGDGGPIAPLVTLRECIEAAIAELIRRRRVQEPAKPFREKIHSLGRHCAVSGLPGGFFDRLVADGEKLIDDLSDGKQRAWSRGSIVDLFNTGLLYLKALLDSIDAAKLRAP